MKRFISFSGGVESTTMCILYGKDAKAIFSDTGSEHDKLYERLETVQESIRIIHPDFEIIKVKSEKYDSLEDAVIKQRFMPSGQARYCTRIFKIEPIDNFLKSKGECELMIGFNVDEDRTGNHGLLSNVKYLYPLQDEGYTRKDCEDILNMYGLHPNFPAYMMRGGCRMCFFKSEKEYKALWYMNRKEFDELVKFEERYQDNRKKFYSIMPSGKSLKQLVKECENENLFHDELVKIYNEYNASKKSCGAFCHR